MQYRVRFTDLSPTVVEAETAVEVLEVSNYKNKLNRYRYSE
jgi:hypothetical protein